MLYMEELVICGKLRTGIGLYMDYMGETEASQARDEGSIPFARYIYK